MTIGAIVASVRPRRVPHGCSSPPAGEVAVKKGRNVVFRLNLAAEGLANSSHPKGEHSKGSLIHDNATGILIYRNLYANNQERNPLIKGGGQAAIYAMVTEAIIARLDAGVVPWRKPWEGAGDGVQVNVVTKRAYRG